MASLFLTIKNIFHGVVAAFMLIPILLTMGDAGNPDTPVEIYPESDNPYIAEYLNPDISAHRSGAGIAPQNTLMAFENIIEQVDEKMESEIYVCYPSVKADIDNKIDDFFENGIDRLIELALLTPVKLDNPEYAQLEGEVEALYQYALLLLFG